MRPYQSLRQYFFLFLVICLVACTDWVTLNEADRTATTSESLPTVMTTPTLTTPTIEITSATTQPELFETCPYSMDLDGGTLWSEGSVLFRKPQGGIWAISANNSVPTLVYEQDSWTILSNDGTKLLHFEQNELGSVEGHAIIYDLVQEEEISVPREAVWFIFWDWLADGGLKYLINQERLFGLGEVREFVLVDSTTGHSEFVIEELELPGYQFYEEPFYTGIASVDPTAQLVLYTTLSNQGTADVALRDKATGTIIWQQEGILAPHPYPHPEPEWTDDGSRVLFGMLVSEGDVRFYKLFIVGRDGQEEALTAQPFPLLAEDWQLGHLSRSPNERYIHYNVWQLDGEGPGFIVDTTSSKAGEICDPDTVFLSGVWVAEEQLLYQVRQEDGSMSLRILDIPSWTTQTVFEAEAGYAVNLVGWTPLEFP